MGLCARAEDRKTEPSWLFWSAHWAFKVFRTEGYGRNEVWSSADSQAIRTPHTYFPLLFPLFSLSSIFPSFSQTSEILPPLPHAWTWTPLPRDNLDKTNMKWLRNHTEPRWHVFDNPQSILRWKKGNRLGRGKRKEIRLHFSMNSKILQLPKLEKWLRWRTKGVQRGTGSPS